jgi:hypothetical protein
MVHILFVPKMLQANKSLLNLLFQSELLKNGLYILLFVGKLVAQDINYVSNPSFEYTLPKDTAGGWDKALYWSAIDSTDCGGYLLATKKGGQVPGTMGYQWPRTGENYIASVFYCHTSTCPGSDRIYPRNRLKKVLKFNTAYCAKYFVVNTNNCVVGIDSYGAYFGNSLLDTSKTCLVPLTYLIPQIQYTGGIIKDTLNWVPITGTFVAQGGEKYMLLGNFKTNANTNTLIINPTYLPSLGTDVLIDDVSLIEYNLPAFAGRDTFVVPGSSVFLGRQPEPGLDELCTWFKVPSNIPIDTVAGFTVNPVTSVTYAVRQEICGNVKWDTVNILVGDVGLTEQILNRMVKIYPSPVSTDLQVEFLPTANIKIPVKYSLLNNLDQTLREEDLDGTKALISVRELPEGIYFLKLAFEEYCVYRRFVVYR